MSFSGMVLKIQNLNCFRSKTNIKLVKILACTSRPVKEGTFPMTFLLDVVGGVIPGEGKESREKNEAMNAGN